MAYEACRLAQVWLCQGHIIALCQNLGLQGRLEDRVTEKVDVYSFGVCLWEIWMLGEQIHPDLSLPDIFNGAIQGTLCPKMPAECPSAW